MPLHRNCDRCGKRYKPHTLSNKLCKECRREAVLARLNGANIALEKHRCPYCNLVFRYKEALRNHVSRH